MSKAKAEVIRNDIKRSAERGNKYGYYYLAKIHIVAKEPQEAIKVIEEGLKRYPNFTLLKNLQIKVIEKYGSK